MYITANHYIHKYTGSVYSVFTRESNDSFFIFSHVLNFTKMAAATHSDK